MAGYQPRHDTDPVWWNEEQVNDLDIASAQVGVRITGIFGWDDRPDVRDTREVRSGMDGEVADNLYLGGRTITLDGEVYGSSWADLQARKRSLSALFMPSSTERVLQVPDPATTTPATIYADQMSGYDRMTGRVIESIEFGDTLDPSCQTWQVVLRASDPRRYTSVEESAITDDISTGGGRSFPRTYEKSYGTAEPGGTVDIVNVGSMESPWTVRVYGPVTNPIIEDVSGLGQIVIDGNGGLAIVEGDYLEIDVLERTAFLNSDSEQSRFRYINFEETTWWMLPSGSSTIRFRGSAVSDPAYIEIVWRPANI